MTTASKEDRALTRQRAEPRGVAVSELLGEDKLNVYGYLLLPIGVMQTAGSAAQTVAGIRSHWGIKTFADERTIAVAACLDESTVRRRHIPKLYRLRQLCFRMPSGTVFVSESHASGFVPTTPPANTNGTVSFAGGTIAAGSTATFTITVHADSGLSQGTQLSNTATASAATTDLTPGNNSSTLVTIVNNFDFGDAPNSHGTTLPTGARHKLGSGLFLGTTIDAEVDGQPSATASGDDSAGIDDEDGVSLPATIVAGLGATVNVIASAPGKLDAWLDFNGNGVFDASEQVKKGTIIFPAVAATTPCWAAPATTACTAVAAATSSSAAWESIACMARTGMKF